MTIRSAVAAASTVFLALGALPVAAQICTGEQSAGTVKLVTEATDLRNAKGEVAFTVYANDPNKFLARGGKLLRVRVPTVVPVTRACFWLPPGQYEIAQYHDENADHHFNRTLFVPKEGFGFSNDASTTLGIPSIKAARFTLPPGGTTIRMRMRYRR